MELEPAVSRWKKSGTENARGRLALEVAGPQARKVEWTVTTCDYNGWNDAPEEEREWFDQHPEIWWGPAREADSRPLRVTPNLRARRWR